MFLRNGWYAAIWSRDLNEQPVGRTFLNEKVVLFRNASGQVGALEDCCCHLRRRSRAANGPAITSHAVTTG